ncbi:hypothetical protein TW95_gp0244 [Pandoravirus inopinatum]|uniref:Uncharacterized protein n=1 Tax=Pandoravirus inopinatum TaxID=1605721 RepID=A0A0B5IWA7_9VIRU|nr:hypothetical protein TW95_gp0244 [Pandoravirus inopinatum]AJF96978.1 hypothetical protein [Pandoravirus inopinatum]
MDIDRILGLPRTNDVVTNETTSTVDDTIGTDNDATGTNNDINMGTSDNTVTDAVINDTTGTSATVKTAVAAGQGDFYAAKEADCKPAADNAVKGNTGESRTPPDRASSAVRSSPVPRAAVPKRPWIDAACLGREISSVFIALVVSIVVVSIMRPHAVVTETTPSATASAAYYYYVPKQPASTPTPVPSPEPCWCLFSNNADEGLSKGQLVGTDCVCHVAVESAQPSLDGDDGSRAPADRVTLADRVVLALAVPLLVLLLIPMAILTGCPM